MKAVSILAAVALFLSLSPPAHLSAHKFERISIEQGLSHGSVYSIVQDKKGFMWFGTEDGLNKYDGYNMTVFRHKPDNPNSLSSSTFGKIFIDKSGIMWLGTWGGGLNRYDPKNQTFSHFRYEPDNPHSLSQNNIECICRDTAGNLWIGTDEEGLNRFDEKTGRFIRYRHDPNNPKSLSNNEVKAILEDNSGFLWIGTDHGLNRMQRESEMFVHYRQEPRVPATLSDNRIRAIFQDRLGVLWIGTRDGGLNKFDRNTDTFKSYKKDDHNPGSISDNSITQIFEDSEGSLWIGTYNGGLNLFDRETETFSHFKYDPRDPHSLSHNRVEVIYEDRSKVLWLGTRGGGLNKMDLKPAKFNNYLFNPHNTNSLPHPSVLAVVENPANNIIWIGTDGGGLTRFDTVNNQFTHFTNDPNSPDSLSNNRVWSLLVDKKGILWAGTHAGGLNKISRSGDTYHFTRFTQDPDNPDGTGKPTTITSNRIQVIAEDKDGDIWLGTGHGVNRLTYQNPTKISFKRYLRNHRNPNSLSSDRVNIIYPDSSGYIWIGTDEGLNRLDKKTGEFTCHKHHDSNPESMSNNFVHTIYETTTALWIGTDGGLDKFNRRTQTFKHYTETDGLPANQISAILSDQRGNLWISTTKGLSMFNPITEVFRNYGISDGLYGRGFNRNACFKRKNGEILFGSIAGLTIFSPSKVKDNPVIPPVVLTSVKTFNRKIDFREPVSELKELLLSYKDDYISFEFAALDYTHPSQNRYAYKMKGIDQDWIFSGTRRTAVYSNLSPGEYEFQAIGTNNDGVWNKDGVSVKLTITPPPWQTWWFRIPVLLVLGILIFIAYRVRINRIKERNLELNETNIRLEEQIRKRETAEAERASLQEQLRHVQKMETIGTLAGGIAHDFNNILGPILGYTQMALEETPPDGVTRDWLENVQKAAYRAKELVQQILLFGRREKQELKPVRVQIIVREALRLIRASFPATIDIQQDIPTDCDPVLGDPTQLHQVFINLCTNARQALQDSGGILKVKVEMIEVDTEFADTHPNLHTGKYVRLTVSDTGHGMDPVTLERLFEPFYTTKQPGEGTGLGLSVVHGIVMEHSGEVTVASEPGKGTRFEVYLPAYGHDITEETMELEYTPRGTEHILLVDDEESMVIMGKIMLRQLGYKVTSFTESKKALAAFQENPHRFDLVITDQTMPQLTGIQLSKAMAAIRPGLPIIIISGFSKSIDQNNIKQYGISAYLPKPFDAHTIGTTIRKLLADG
jgi:ligand-binding sensor domain-containing protein/signal transduction histidine kinase/CheY-like chemotaxis protein